MTQSQEKILVTGGAGFIGRAVVAELLTRGFRVRVLDNLIPQVHGNDPSPDLPGEVEFIHADIRDVAQVRSALDGIGSVIHLAAEVGVGQSMYAIERYTGVNDLGTAVLLEQMIDQPIRRIVTASSMSIYGEGLYEDADGRQHETAMREPDAVRDKQWDPLDKKGRPLVPLPTPETKRPSLASVYAIGKYVQERMTMTVAQAYGTQAVALRLWNVFGPGQALSNPYTGVLAIFASRIANGQRPLVFEDGEQLRDFVHVDDVARAFCDALVSEEAPGKVLNIASGRPRSVNEVARDLARAMGSELRADISEEGRAGDIRHCIADISAAREVLGFLPREDFHERLVDLVEWVASQEAVDNTVSAEEELRTRGLVI